tara:strand:- start:84 stop:815 length:732 start_codon:yes stop_codon:yes gene_type:complete
MEVPPPTYEVHDYSAVEEHITRQSERKTLANRAKNAAVFSSYLKYGALGVIALGIAAFFVLWGVSLFKGEKIKIVEKEVVVEKPTKIEIILPENFKKNSPQAPAESSDESAKLQERIKELENNLRTQSRNNGDKVNEDAVDVTENYVIFRQVGVNVPGFLQVQTGLQYRDSKQSYPYSQFCYSLKQDGKDVIWVSLANKTGCDPIEEAPFDQVSHHVSRPQYQQLTDHCRFLIDRHFCASPTP